MLRRIKPCYINRYQFKAEVIHRYMVSIDGRNIRYIRDPSIEVQRLAVKNRPESIVYIPNPTDEIKRLIRDT